MENMNNDLPEVSFDFEALSSCPFCETRVMIPNGKIIWFDIDFWYVICPECGLKYMNPRPTMQSYRDFYKDLFWQQKIRNVGFRQTGQMWGLKRYSYYDDKVWEPEEGKKNLMEKDKAHRVTSVIPTIADHIKIQEDTDIIEVGCGFGVVLKELNQKYNCKVYAIEPSEEARNVLIDYKSVELVGRYAEELVDIANQDKKFDVIIFSHSLENTNDPVLVIDAAKKCLKQGGVIYIQTPNLLVFDQMNPYHPFIFSESSLRRLAKKVGLNYKQVSPAMDRMLVAILN